MSGGVKPVAYLVLAWMVTAACPAQDHWSDHARSKALATPLIEQPEQVTAPARSTGTPLPRPSQLPGGSGSQGNAPLLSGRPSALRWISSLLMVLSAFWLVLHVANRRKRSAGRLPADAFQWLGKWPLSGKHQLHLVRLGSRLLLLSTADGSLQPVTEISDPAEVESLLEACQWPQAGPLPPALSRLSGKHLSWKAEG